MNTKEDQASVERARKVDAANNWIEAMGELFISERFTSVCEDPREIAAAKIERWTDGPMNRIMIEPDLFDEDRDLMTVERLESDLKYLLSLVETNPKGFEGLIAALGDVDLLRERGIELGLTEQQFIAANGGWAWLLIIPLVLALTGCPSETPSGTGAGKCWNKGPEGYHCTRKPHNSGRHRVGSRTWR